MMALRITLLILLTLIKPMTTLAMPPVKNVDKRSFYISHPTEPDDPQFWASSTIARCFAEDSEGGSANDFITFGLLTRDAMQAWRNAAQDGDKATAITDEYKGACAGDPGNKWLHVRLNNEDRFAATLGFQQVETTPGQPFNLMLFDVDMDPPRKREDVLANLIHELGHIFGMDHEHQRPMAWVPSGMYYIFYSFDVDNLPKNPYIPDWISKEYKNWCGDVFLVKVAPYEYGGYGWAVYEDIAPEFLKVLAEDLSNVGSK